MVYEEAKWFFFIAYDNLLCKRLEFLKANYKTQNHTHIGLNTQTQGLFKGIVVAFVLKNVHWEELNKISN